MIFDFLRKKKYSHFFVYKWGIGAGIVETLLILFSVFSMLNINSLFKNNPQALLIFNTFYWIIAVIFTFFIVFGMPLHLIFKKRMTSTALLVLLMTISTLFVFFTFLLLLAI